MHVCVCVVCNGGKQGRYLAECFSLFMAACLLNSKHKHDHINKHYSEMTGLRYKVVAYLFIFLICVQNVEHMDLKSGNVQQ